MNAPTRAALLLLLAAATVYCTTLLYPSADDPDVIVKPGLHVLLPPLLIFFGFLHGRLSEDPYPKLAAWVVIPTAIIVPLEVLMGWGREEFFCALGMFMTVGMSAQRLLENERPA